MLKMTSPFKANSTSITELITMLLLLGLKRNKLKARLGNYSFTMLLSSFSLLFAKPSAAYTIWKIFFTAMAIILDLTKSIEAHPFLGVLSAMIFTSSGCMGIDMGIYIRNLLSNIWLERIEAMSLGLSFGTAIHVCIKFLLPEGVILAITRLKVHRGKFIAVVAMLSMIDPIASLLICRLIVSLAKY